MTVCARWWAKVLICRWAGGREKFVSNGANVGLTCVYAKFWGGYFAGLCCRTCFSMIWGQVADAEGIKAGAEEGLGCR